MHDIEPYYNWQHLYIAAKDNCSPFFGREYSEFEFINSIYGYCIHPQWDDIGSPTLFIKILYVEYDERFAIIELLGEWNDCINNDVMFLKRDIIDKLIENGITKFILIGENIFNFHYSDESYYEEWFEDIPDGWIVFLNFRNHVLSEFSRINIEQFVFCIDEASQIPWRTFNPLQLFQIVERLIVRNYLPQHNR